ncbi:MAG: hypothetical protein HBSAPP03_26560 [Phycisphaerae bacterium]|nr:MAG: hypothetical protein HBSAPP03_26560 [Phycisphaerae bacterium]
MSGNSTWGREAFAWMVARAGPLPKAVVIGAVPLDEPDDRLHALRRAGCSAAEGLIVPESGGDHDAAAKAFDNTRIAFIRGGDQGRYVKGWRGTKTEAALRHVFDSGGVVAGTSAGCAVLGEVTYSAEKNSLTPEEALADPFHEDLTLVRDFLGLVPGVLFDTHFTERARFARLPVLLARSRDLFDDRRDMLGLGMDTRTAAAVIPDGSCTILGEGAATLMRLSEKTICDLRPGHSPTITHVRCDMLLAGTTLALPTGVVATRPDEAKPNPHPDVVDESAFEALKLDGGRDEDAAAGILRVAREGEGDQATWRIRTGEGRLPGCLVVPRAWGRGVWERTAAAQHALTMQPGLLGWFIGEGCTIEVDASGLARVHAESTSSAVVIDTRGVTHTGVRQPESSRPKVHLEGATLHVLGPGWGLDLRSRAVLHPAMTQMP